MDSKAKYLIKRYLLSFKCSSNISELHTDGPMEHSETPKRLRASDIEQLFSWAYTPDLNDIAAQVIRKLVDDTDALLIQDDLFNILMVFCSQTSDRCPI